MATVSATTYPSYVSISSIKKYWLDTIAPSYFDFDNVNNYNVGIFGYVNEVMGNTAEDTFNSVAITRREFYPVTAQFISSLYTMATLQSIDIPLTKPATCRCILIFPQTEIISNSTRNNDTGNYECIIDDCLKIFAGDLQFMLDYPIKIISRRNSVTREWSHTVHYDITIFKKNSLSAMVPDRYISSKVIRENGTYYLALFIDYIRQVTMEEKTQVIVKDTILDTVTMDVDFDGNLANFEVFYRENANTEEVQLTKIMLNAPMTGNDKYVQYELINQNKIRLTFTYNTYWTPKFNSEIITRIYTSEGASGNFNQFTEDIVCSSASEKYPYNANMTIIGKISGSATGGADQMLTQEFRNKVVMAYATNRTISTENDLQLYFDDIADDINGIKILFRKKRDDVFIRLFGAYSVYKDENENVIPTNTLEAKLRKSDLVDDISAVNTVLKIPAGSVFTYEADDSFTAVPVMSDGHPMNLMEAKRTLSGSDGIYFANPFMVLINTDPNSCGYYMNSLSKILPVEYTFINDNSFQQFIGSSIEIYRNSLAGNNFYRIRMRLAATADSEITDFVGEEVDETRAENQLKATRDGMVMAEEYYHDEALNQGYIRYVIRYSNNTIAYIRGSNTSPIVPAGITGSTTGYKMKMSVGDSFRMGDVLAIKRRSDLGNIALVADIGGKMHSADCYIPMTIQEVDEETGALIFEGYVATEDSIDTSEKIMFIHGIYDSDGNEVSNLALSMKDQSLVCDALFRDPDATGDSNARNTKFRNYVGLEDFTHTNTYKTSDDYSFDLITALGFIRSTISFYPISASDPDQNNDFWIYIDEVPLIGAMWAADRDQFDYFVQQYTNLNESLNGAYLSLNNTFSIDSKFYNTYGKARFYTVGNNKDNMQSLDNVRCRFHFGVKLTTISNLDDFVNKFRNYVRDYIESSENITVEGQDIYIISLLSALKENFEEIIYLEYYAFNSYDYSAQKIVGPDLSTYQKEFIPEFLNLNIVKDSNGSTYPDVTVDILS